MTPLPPRSFAEWRAIARRRLPRGVFDYIDRGVASELSLARDRERLDAATIVPKVLRGAEPPVMATEILGTAMAAPIVIAPTALAGLVERAGEIRMARAAARLGLPVCLSTQSVTPIEAIRAEVPEAAIWMQLYSWADEELTFGLMRHAAGQGAEVLVPTLDTPVPIRKDWNDRRGFGMPFRWTARTMLDVALHAPWAARVILPELLRGGMPAYGHYPEGSRPTLTRASGDPRVGFAPPRDWDAVTRIRDRWTGKLLLKGICAPEDAVKAAEIGADGIVVSSHGGRNFDACPAVLDLLPDICGAVGGRIAVMADSGVRHGLDVLKYLHAGAAGVMSGRLPLWGLAAAGEDGAQTALGCLLQELEEAMILSGLHQADLPGMAAPAARRVA
ncbi:alpha-hydroxy acid oxidase [Mangrovicoccus sp. HB161399]|uniref:alpha-hydroxy acid oxidase n=1 Tax=Mangrovicoccus sp. HB161399 TaxID=2720392 RepID=UPI001557DC46|nr:alpha-hydroxy acid oxidase [Mangrovicoccus sp. HB161399]